MQRRDLLRRGIAIAGGAGLWAGCVGDGQPGGEPTATPTTAPPRVTDTSLTPLSSTCGSQVDDASVGFDTDRVTVEGTIWGADACAVPTLRATDYDADADELTVTVATRRRDADGGTACAQCISELSYRVRVTFAGGLPDSVRVVHVHGDDGTTVTTGTR